MREPTTETTVQCGTPTCKVGRREACHPALRGQSGEAHGDLPQLPQKPAAGGPNPPKSRNAL